MTHHRIPTLRSDQLAELVAVGVLATLQPAKPLNQPHRITCRP